MVGVTDNSHYLPPRRAALRTAPNGGNKMTTKQTTTKPAEQSPAKQGPAWFIDAPLMEREIALRKEGRTMKQIGADLGVKATGYLAKKIKETYAADALAPAPKAQPAEDPAPAEQAK